MMSSEVGLPGNMEPEALSSTAAELGLAQLQLEVVSVRPATYGNSAKEKGTRAIFRALP